jgi:hypothetical protein
MLVTCQLTSQLRPQLPLLILSGYGIALVVGEVEDGVEAPGLRERGKNSAFTVVAASSLRATNFQHFTTRKFQKMIFFNKHMDTNETLRGIHPVEFC